MQRNVVIIVVDTLRQDYSQALEKLLTFGFVKYNRTISQSSWTLPSHVSMFTGQLPSKHQVHESLGVYARRLMKISQAALNTEDNLLSNLKRRGYTTYCASANPFISPQFGFHFDHYRGFDFTGDNKAMLDLALVLEGDLGAVKTFVTLLKARAYRTVANRAYYRLVRETGALLRREQMDKGSKFISKHLKTTAFSEPFFLFVNLMEAHEPYRWGEDYLAFLPSVLGIPVGLDRWKTSYPNHANLAIRRATDLYSTIQKYDPFVIVTSDHGQFLGEGGRYGHGYSLDSNLVNVPLYIRFPRGQDPFGCGDSPISLLEVPKMVESAVMETSHEIGSEYAFSESFGCQDDLSKYAKGKTNIVNQIYAERVKVVSKGGSLTFNKTTGVVETATEGLSSDEIRDQVEMIQSYKHSETVKPTESMTTADEEIVLKRLRDLGYE